MSAYDLGGIIIKTGIPTIHNRNKIILIPKGHGFKFNMKYNPKRSELVFWQPTGLWGLGNRLGIQIEKLTTGKRVNYIYESAAEYKEEGKRVFAKTRVYWIITSNDSVHFSVEISY